MLKINNYFSSNELLIFPHSSSTMYHEISLKIHLLQLEYKV